MVSLKKLTSSILCHKKIANNRKSYQRVCKTGYFTINIVDLSDIDTQELNNKYCLIYEVAGITLTGVVGTLTGFFGVGVSF